MPVNKGVTARECPLDNVCASLSAGGLILSSASENSIIRLTLESSFSSFPFLSFFVLRFMKNLIRNTPETRMKRREGRSPENFKATPAAMAHAQDHHSSDGVFIFPVPVGLIILSVLRLSDRCFGAFAFIVSGSEISALVSESLITRAHFRNSASSPVFTLYMSSCFSSFVSTSSKNGSDRNISRRSAPSEERQTDSGELLYGRRQNLIYEPSSSVKTYSGSRTIADGLIRLSSSSGTEQKKSPADLLLSSS